MMVKEDIGSKVIEILNDKIDRLEGKVDKIYEEIHDGYIDRRVDKRIAEKFGRVMWKIILSFLFASGGMLAIWNWIVHR